MLLKETHHRWIFLLALCLVAVGLPISKAFMSIGGIILAANFLLEGRYMERWNRLIRSPVLLALIAVYALHLIGLIWTSDYGFALKDLRVKLPLLLYPVVLALSEPLKRKEFLLITGLFSATVILTSFISTYAYLQIRHQPTVDFRAISLFTSHIRYALMVCLAYLFLLHLAWNEEKNTGARLSYTLLAVWLSVFVFILQSMTGIVVWLLCSYLLLLYTLSFIKNNRLKTISYTALTITPLMVSFYIILQVDAFYPDKQPNFQVLESHTEGGEAYTHDTTSLNLENGHFINMYLAPEELEREWNKRSELKFWTDLDRSGQAINATLIRYLTSKGLRKDSAGVNALTEDDIAAIENGVANVRFIYGNPLDNRVYTVIWEFDRLLKEKRVQGHSVTQRFVFWQTGWEIFKEHWLFGVGTGDIDLSFDQMYDRMDIKLMPEYRLRTHNQYLAIAISFGIFGLLAFLFSIISPFLFNQHANSFLYIGFSIILYASMLNEDTLETQNGVTLYAFFNALLLFGKGRSLDQAEQTAS